MTKTKRPFGLRIREVLTAQQSVGVTSAWQTAKQVPHIAATNVAKYLDRAVELGFAAVDKTQRPRVYSVKPDWQALMAAYELKPRLQHSRKPRIRGIEPMKREKLPEPHPLAAAWA